MKKNSLSRIFTNFLLFTLFSLQFFISLTNCQLGGNEIFECSNKCALPITWDVPVTACGQDNNNYLNALCDATLSTDLQCLIKGVGRPFPNVGISYPGSCGCFFFF